MLCGGYQHNIDKKGRLAIPAKFRDDLGEEFIICKGLYKNTCLAVYSMSEWEKFEERIEKLPFSKANALKRFVYDGAFNVEFDTQGRILVPAVLREYAKLEGEVHIVGMRTNIEIWNTELWNTEQQESQTPESVQSIIDGVDF